MRDHITLDEVLAIEDPTEKHDALIDWLMLTIGYPYEFGRKLSLAAVEGAKRARTQVMIAEGAILHPNNHTGLFGPRIIFFTMIHPGSEKAKRGDWFFTMVFQGPDKPKDFSEPYRLTLRQIEESADKFKVFMEDGITLPVERVGEEAKVA